MAGQFRAAVEKFCANGKKIHDHRATRSAVGGACVQNGSRERAANDLHKSRMAHTCKTTPHCRWRKALEKHMEQQCIKNSSLYTTPPATTATHPWEGGFVCNLFDSGKGYENCTYKKKKQRQAKMNEVFQLTMCAGKGGK